MQNSATAQQKLLESLDGLLVCRDVRRGFATLDRAFPQNFILKVPSLSLLLCIAQWVDIGYRDLTFLNTQLAGFDRQKCSSLCVADYARLCLIDAFLALSEGRSLQAISMLDFVLHLGEEILGRRMHFLAHFWKSRSHRKLGEYERAMEHIAAARIGAQSSNAPKLVAITKIHESWLVFQSGKRQHAFELLDEAEVELKPTGHNLSLGNIESARGRFVRRSGDYTRALRHFESAMELYSVNNPTHPNMARALTNAAYVKRLIALDLQAQGNHGHARGDVHAKSLQATHEALTLLDRAGAIYTLHGHQGGTGSVLVNAAHLHLESGEIDEAAVEAEHAYSLGQTTQDQILMARARIAQSAVELARSEEELGENPNVALHANLSVEYADQAISISQGTQNKRLLCEACIARGMASASDFLQDWKQAKNFASQASSLLAYDDRDHLYQQLRTFKIKLGEATHIDERLRLWSDGQTDSKTFQQIQEEFAELVIPKVWLGNSKNTSAVAKILSISPKKVRRVLRSAMHKRSLK